MTQARLLDIDSGLTVERLRDVLRYEPDTGLFFWKLRTCRSIQVGELAGCAHPVWRYRGIKIDGREYKAHRLAWFYVHGIWPKHQIDHINGDRTDNRISNLRDVTASVNSQNQVRPMRTNKTGFLGVDQHVGRYRAKIFVRGRVMYLGHFDTPEEASEAYLTAKRQQHAGCTI
jgi:hypothetical protein